MYFFIVLSNNLVLVLMPKSRKKNKKNKPNSENKSSEKHIYLVWPQRPHAGNLENVISMPLKTIDISYLLLWQGIIFIQENMALWTYAPGVWE